MHPLFTLGQRVLSVLTASQHRQHEKVAVKRYYERLAKHPCGSRCMAAGTLNLGGKAPKQQSVGQPGML